MKNTSRANKIAATAFGAALALTSSFAKAGCDACAATTPEEFKNMTNGLVIVLDPAKDEPETFNGVTVENGSDLEALGITSLKQRIDGKVNDAGLIESQYTAVASILGGACSEVTYTQKLRNQGIPVGFQAGYLNKDWRWAGSEPFAPNNTFIPGNAFSATATNTVGEGFIRMEVVADKRVIAKHEFAKTAESQDGYDPSRTAVVIDPSASATRPNVYTLSHTPGNYPSVKPY
ncbi:MAG: hypothetical protein ABTQ34_05640 [Bdellovibrionales bacterium]